MHPQALTCACLGQAAEHKVAELAAESDELTAHNGELAAHNGELEAERGQVEADLASLRRDIEQCAAAQVDQVCLIEQPCA